MSRDDITSEWDTEVGNLDWIKILLVEYRNVLFKNNSKDCRT